MEVSIPKRVCHLQRMLYVTHIHLYGTCGLFGNRAIEYQHYHCPANKGKCQAAHQLEAVSSPYVHRLQS